MPRVTVAVLSSSLSHPLEMEKGDELSISSLEHTFPIEYHVKESSCCSEVHGVISHLACFYQLCSDGFSLFRTICAKMCTLQQMSSLILDNKTFISL